MKAFLTIGEEGFLLARLGGRGDFRKKKLIK